MSIEPFNRLIKLAGRAFYDDVSTKGDSQPKSGRSDNRGVAVVVLDALTRRQWVREEDLAKDLKLHSKQLRRTLRFFEEEKLVTRDHRKETAKGAKIFSAAVAATVDSQNLPKDGEEKIKLHTHSYCCLDYAQVYDVIRYRLHRMKKKIKDELDNKNTVQEYICPNCGKRYNALDALRLISFEDEYFHCEGCNGELVAESDNIAAQDGGDGDDNARRRRREKLRDMLQNMETQLKPLVDQLSRVKDLAVPEFGSLQSWEARASAAGCAVNDPTNNISSRSSQGLLNGSTPMPFVGETKVEVAISGVEVKEEDRGSENEPTKVLPPWMIKQGMRLTNEQRGESRVKEEIGDGTNSRGWSDVKKVKVDEESEEKSNIQDAYIKAYYAAMFERQQQQGLCGKQIEEKRVVGMKGKREEEEYEVGDDDDVEWEEPLGAPGGGELYKVGDLNVEAAETCGEVNNKEVVEEEEDDEIDWEVG